MLPFLLYPLLAEEFDYGAISSLEFKDSQAAKSYILKQIETANSVGKMSDIFAIALYEYVKSIPNTTKASEVYALTEAETIRLVNVVGIPAPANYDKWLNFLASAEGASQSAADREKEATIGNVLGETAKKTKKDVEEKTDPRKSLIPWIVGGFLFLYLTRK